MATKKQIAANRRNSKLSTGPKTPEGKATVSRNRLTHGLCARETVLPKEDHAEFSALVASLEDCLHPENELDQILIEQLASAHWRMRRINRMETGLLISRVEKAREYDEVPDEGPEPERTDEEAQYDEHSSYLGEAFHRNCGSGTFSRLMRYEANLRRGFYKALEQLRRRPPRPAAQPPAPETKPTQPTPPAPPADPPQAPQSTTPESKLALNRPAPSPAKPAARTGAHIRSRYNTNGGLVRGFLLRLACSGNRNAWINQNTRPRYSSPAARRRNALTGVRRWTSTARAAAGF